MAKRTQQTVAEQPEPTEQVYTIQRKKCNCVYDPTTRKTYKFDENGEIVTKDPMLYNRLLAAGYEGHCTGEGTQEGDNGMEQEDYTKEENGESGEEPGEEA